MIFTGRCFKSLLIYIYKKKEIHCNDLEDGYKVAHLQREMVYSTNNGMVYRYKVTRSLQVVL